MVPDHGMGSISSAPSAGKGSHKYFSSRCRMPIGDGDGSGDYEDTRNESSDDEFSDQDIPESQQHDCLSGIVQQGITKKRKWNGNAQHSSIKRTKIGSPKDTKHQHGRSTSTVGFNFQPMERKQSVPSSVQSRRSASPDSVLGAQSSDDEMLAAFANHRHGSSEMPAKSLTRQTTPDSVVGDDESDSSSVPPRRMADLERGSVKRVTQKAATISDTADEQSCRHVTDTRGHPIHHVNSRKAHVVEDQLMQDAPPYSMQGQSASAIQDTTVFAVPNQASDNSNNSNSKIMRLRVGRKGLESLIAQKTAAASPPPVGHAQRANSPVLPHMSSSKSQMTPIKDMIAALNRMRAAREREAIDVRLESV